MPSTTLERLRMLTAIASNGTIAGAARSLGYTASAVSQHLSLLEREAGVSLVERSNRGVTLTSAGRLLADRSGEILDQVRNAFDDVGASMGQYETTLVVAAFPTAITGILLPLREQLAPSIRLRIVDAESEDALRSLAAREIDAAITDGSAHRLHAGLQTFERIPLRTEPVRLVTRVDNTGATLESFADSEWVLSGPESPIGFAIRELCGSLGFAPSVIAETDDHRVAFEVILATGAVAALPELALSELPDEVTIVEDVQLPFARSIEFTTRKSLSLNPAVAELARLLARAAHHDS